MIAKIWVSRKPTSCLGPDTLHYVEFPGINRCIKAKEDKVPL